MCPLVNLHQPGQFISYHFDLMFQVSVFWRKRELLQVSKDCFSVHACSCSVDTFHGDSPDT